MPAGTYDAKLRGDSTVTTLVSILRFDLPARRQIATCMVFKDSLPAEDYRRLISLVRMGG